MIDLEFTPVGFEAMDAGWWPETANALARPWPRAAVLFDLRWWRGQERATAKVGARKRARMPGRPALAQRWGWKDWDVRLVLRAEREWGDTWTHTSDSPASLQPPSSDPPAVSTENAGNPLESSSDSPASLQPPSSDPPRACVFTGSPDHLPDGGTRAHEAPNVPPSGRVTIPATLDELWPAEVSLSRPARALAYAGITPVILLQMTEEDLRKTPGVAGSWRVITEGLKAGGWRLRDPEERARASPKCRASDPIPEPGSPRQSHENAMAYENRVEAEKRRGVRNADGTPKVPRG